jgi:integrase/recombinase XerD
MTSKSSVLEQAICDYLLWMISNGYAESTYLRYEQALKHFFRFVARSKIPWEAVFTLNTLEAFRKESGLTHASKPVRGLSRYLFQRKRIQSPIKKSVQKLPQIYEEYLSHYEKVRQVHHLQILRVRRTLSAFNAFLEKDKIDPTGIRIEHIDAFLTERNANYTPVTRQNQRSNLRGFLTFLYQRGIVHRDLASFVVGAPVFAQSKPPRFLRPHEIQKLFEILGRDLSTPKALRSFAMLHLAYTLGLRPIEISRIRLDDIFFRKKEISLRDRKSKNPVRLPISEDTIQSIAAYIVGARPDGQERTLFLKIKAPYGPITPGGVSSDISGCMRKANLPASAYWLRHTYAQNLLEKNASIFEIKEMLGHDSIQTTRHYLHIHTKLMREVLFDETL